MTIQEYFGDWSKVVNLNEADRILRKLSASNHITCPPIKDVFKAFRLCSLSNLRVVILGQDPYPQKGVATGVAFANNPDTPEDSISPSLEVLRESVIDNTIPHRTVNFDPSLEKWEEQGVLLLNSALTCEAGRVGSHTLMWTSFMINFLTSLQKCSTGIVYVLMGRQAQGFESYINQQFNQVLKCKHPSYYARTNTRMPSDIWKQINQILIGQNGYGIEWYQEY